MLQFLIGIFFISTSLHYIGANGTNDTAKIYEKVGLYLRRKELMTKQKDESSNDYLQNSNKIGLGFNPVYGSPVCYTRTCQMEGFSNPVFKLQYQSSSPGACTNKLIPNFVSLNCLPSAVTSASTEFISSLKQLPEIISSRVEVSIGASYNAFSFSYTNSKETSYMVDNIVQNNMTLMYTSAQPM